MSTNAQTTTRIPAELKAEQVTALIDTREQLPLCLDPLQIERATLTTGDYSVKGLEHVVAIERKAVGDLLSCIGGSRDRFSREIMRLLAFPYRCLVVECTWSYILRGEWQGKVHPNSARGTLIGWQMMGLPIHFAGSHDQAGQDVAVMLTLAARRRWREARALIAETVQEGE